MKCKLMDIIGGNKKYFILAICLMGLMFSSCRFLTRLYLESGGIYKTTLPLSSDIKMRARKWGWPEDSIIQIRIYNIKELKPAYNFSQLYIRCVDDHAKVTKYLIDRPRFEKGKLKGNDWVDAPLKEETPEDGEIRFGFISPHRIDTFEILPNNFMILSDGTPLFKDTVKIIMDSSYFSKNREKKKTKNPNED